MQAAALPLLHAPPAHAEHALPVELPVEGLKVPAAQAWQHVVLLAHEPYFPEVQAVQEAAAPALYEPGTQLAQKGDPAALK